MSAVRISAARHEHEGFQIVLSPISGATKHVSVEASDLTGPAGKIDHSNITINAATTGISIQAAGTGASVVNAPAGGGGAHNNMPPTMIVNYIIRVL